MYTNIFLLLKICNIITKHLCISLPMPLHTALGGNKAAFWFIMDKQNWECVKVCWSSAITILIVLFWKIWDLTVHSLMQPQEWSSVGVQYWMIHSHACMPKHTKTDTQTETDKHTPTDVRGERKTTVYPKKMDFLHYSSYNPSTPRHSLPYSQLLRVRRICIADNELEKHATTLCDRFASKGYDKNLLDKCVCKVRNVTRDSLLTPKPALSNDQATVFFFYVFPSLSGC